MRGQILTYEEFANTIDTTEYNFEEYAEFQLDVAYEKMNVIANMPPGQREYIGIRSRGGSKTWDEMLFDLYLAQLRQPYILIPKIYGKLPWESPLRGYWFSTSEDQLDQPKEYFDYIIDHSFLRFIMKKKTSTLVRFKHGGKLKLSILTKKKVRSGRGDFISFDEEAQAEKEFYDAAVGIISGSLFGFLSHISTPCIGTVFEENHDKLETRQHETSLNLISKLPWWKIPFLARNKAFYEEEKRTKPAWWYLQEYCAEFTNPSGSVFKDVIYDPYPDWLLSEIKDLPDLSGLDWNPAAGHCLGSIRWLPYRKIIAVTHELNLGAGYSHELEEPMFWKIAPWFTKGNRLVAEDGGINIEYIKWLKSMLISLRFNWPDQQWNKEEWDNQGIAKMAACTWIIQNGYTIHVDKKRFPETAKCIREMHWDKDAKGDPQIAKDPANSPHFGDAFLHAISIKNRGSGKPEMMRFY